MEYGNKNLGRKFTKSSVLQITAYQDKNTKTGRCSNRTPGVQMPSVCHPRTVGRDEHHWKFNKFHFLHLPSHRQGPRSLDQPWGGRTMPDRYLSRNICKQITERFSEFAAALLGSALSQPLHKKCMKQLFRRRGV